jgi:hypothetical protein
VTSRPKSRCGLPFRRADVTGRSSDDGTGRGLDLPVDDVTWYRPFHDVTWYRLIASFADVTGHCGGAQEAGVGAGPAAAGAGEGGAAGAVKEAGGSDCGEVRHAVRFDRQICMWIMLFLALTQLTVDSE